MTREEEAAELLKQIALSDLQKVPTNASESFLAIAELRSRLDSLSGQLNLLTAFITSTPESKQAFREFVKLVANDEPLPENQAMHQAARILDLMYPDTGSPQPPDGGTGPKSSPRAAVDNVILFPGFPGTKKNSHQFIRRFQSTH